jgi:hypothetical protein
MYGMTDKPQTTMTPAEAADETIRLLYRKLRRADRQVFEQVLAMIPDGARQTIMMAENRADLRNANAERDGIALTWPNYYEDVDIDSDD